MDGAPDGPTGVARSARPGRACVRGCACGMDPGAWAGSAGHLPRMMPARCADGERSTLCGKTVGIRERVLRVCVRACVRARERVCLRARMQLDEGSSSL